MIFELWEVVFTERDLAADEGGYEGVRLRTKESIVLKRKSQLLLKQISASRSLDCCFDPIVFSLTHFSLEVIPYTSKDTKQELPKWPQVSVTPFLEYNQEVAKERIKLESQSLETLKWLQGLTPINPKFPCIERIKDNGLEALMLDLYLISMEKVPSGPLKELTAMPSFLQERFMSLTNETLEERAVSRCAGKYDLERFPIVGPLLEGYIIHALSVKDNVRHEKTGEFEEWPIPRETPCERVFQDLQAKLLDHDFDPLDFYKLKVSKVSSATQPKRNKFSPHKVWKVSKEQIRELDWNPLKWMTKEATTTLLSKDVIVAKEYRPHHVSLTFPTMTYNSIDLIDTENKTFGSLKIDNWQMPASMVERPSTGEITIEKQSSSFREEKDSQEITKISTSLLPHGRSFFDEELRSILEVKKRRLAGGKENPKPTAQPTSVNMLRILNKVSNNRDTQTEKNLIPAESIPTVNVPLPTPFQELNLHNIKKSVLVNLSRLKHNHSLIRYLTHANNEISLIEQKQSQPYDFVLNPSTCIIRLQLNTFFQMKDSNDLYYEQTLTHLLTEFRKVIVLVEYRDMMETADRDVFWKIRLYLNRPEFEVHLTSSNDEAIGNWICMLARRYSGQFREFNASSTSEEFLLALNLNKFQVQTLLERYHLSSFLHMILDNDTSQLEDTLSPLQVQRIKSMMLLEW